MIASALEAGKIGTWFWELAGNQLTWSSNPDDALKGTYQFASGGFDHTPSVFDHDIHPVDRAGVIAAIEEALRSHKQCCRLYRLPAQPHDAERWIEMTAVVNVKDGKPEHLVVTCRDVTERIIMHHELRARARQQEAVAQLGELALTERHLQTILDEASARVADILAVEMVSVLELVPGDAELLLRSGVGWSAGLVGAAYVSTDCNTQAGFTLASGGPVIVTNIEAETRFRATRLLRQHKATSGISTPIAGRDGRAYGVLAAHTRTQRKFNEHEVSFLAAVAGVIAGASARLQQDRRQELLIRELRHRSGNLFAQLLALFSQTAKNSNSTAELMVKYEDRVLALANAHRLVTESGWKSAALTELLNTLLAPHIDRIAFTGPNVLLDPDVAFALSMAVHELCSNASQHGSLSSHAGTVEVSWRVTRTERGLALSLNWKERGGPAPKHAPRTGFGTQLITTVTERQLNGKVRQSFRPRGLEAQLVVPLTHERWPAARATANDDLTNDPYAAAS